MKNKATYRGGRKRKELSPREIQRINFLWFVNQRHITDISRILKYSVPVIERNLFPTRREWDAWQLKTMNDCETEGCSKLATHFMSTDKRRLFCLSCFTKALDERIAQGNDPSFAWGKL